MPQRVSDVFDEASDVAARSPRSAAALLRLALQMLVNDLVEGPMALDKKIGELVRRGLRPDVQRAMDLVRVVGNNAVHPGELDVSSSDGDLVPTMFALLNMIVEEMITQPSKIEAIYASLPEGARQSIERRDSGPQANGPGTPTSG